MVVENKSTVKNKPVASCFYRITVFAGPMPFSIFNGLLEALHHLEAVFYVDTAVSNLDGIFGFEIFIAENAGISFVPFQLAGRKVEVIESIGRGIADQYGRGQHLLLLIIGLSRGSHTELGRRRS